MSLASNRHCATLQEALTDWHRLPPPDINALGHDTALRRLTDQVLYRFTKLQDAIGERLVPANLGWLREPLDDWPMRDRPDRLDRLGYLDLESWLQWRDARIRLAHEDPDRPDLRFAAVLATIAASQIRLDADQAWRTHLPT